MSYQFRDILCAAPFDCTDEVKAFQEVVSACNEQDAMPKGLLFCPLFLTMSDKRPFQGAVNENLRRCSFYLQVIEDSWGPPQRDLERDWAFAQRCVADRELPMREAVTLFKAPLLPHKVEPAIVEFKSQLLAAGGPHAEFADLGQFRDELRRLLSHWLAGEA